MASDVSKLTVVEYEALGRIEKLLGEEKNIQTTRGGRTLHPTQFRDNEEMAWRVLRDTMLVMLENCTQMQVRRAVKKHITALDEWSGTSAVESLGRIVQMRAAS